MSRIEAIAAQEVPRRMEEWLGSYVEVEITAGGPDNGHDLKVRSSPPCFDEDEPGTTGGR